MLWVAPNRDAIKHRVWSLTDIVLPLTTQIIVLVCLIVMADKLRKSLKFRQTFKTSDETKENKLPKSSDMATNKKTSSNVSKKDMKVVKQVMLISAVYIVCNTPKIFINVTALLVSDFTLGTRYQNLYLVLNSIRSLFETVNSSASLPIYYSYNGKFRKLKSQNHNWPMLLSIRVFIQRRVDWTVATNGCNGWMYSIFFINFNQLVAE